MQIKQQQILCCCHNCVVIGSVNNTVRSATIVIGSKHFVCANYVFKIKRLLETKVGLFI